MPATKPPYPAEFREQMVEIGAVESVSPTPTLVRLTNISTRLYADLGLPTHIVRAVSFLPTHARPA